jgi:DNA-binding transcriptional MerR regulator
MNKLKVSDFVKLTGSTLKTINYYHKIGLLPEPERSAGGYRLYGSAELNRMRLIKHLKSLGFDLKHIKDIVGDFKDPKNSREFLQSLRSELLNDIKTLEERVAKIDTILGADAPLLDEDIFDSPSFKMTAEILGTDKIEEYAKGYPDIYDQHRKLRGILDDFQWGEDYKQTYSNLALFFKEHPEEYRVSLDYAERLRRISDLDEDDPEFDVFAHESAELIKSMPMLKEILFKQKPIKEPLESVYNELIADVLSPARIRYNKLLQKYLGFEGNASD